MNERLQSRLVNWKFLAATQCLDETVSDDDRALVFCLSRLVGDSGWFEGDIGTLVGIAVATLLPDQDV